MKKIKITTPYGIWPLIRQTPNNSGIWDHYQFFVNDGISECDYWFVFDDLLKPETISCYPSNVVFLALECPAIRPHINSNFLEQFGVVWSYGRNIKHPHTIETISPSPWHIGVNNTSIKTRLKDFKIYDDFKNNSITNKSKLISVISSNKSFTKGHRKRLAFVKTLQKYFGNEIDVFGRGIREVDDKWDAIAPYKYHIALENSSCYNGISEKLYDSLLGEAFTFYYGCPNVLDYFPNNSLIPIDINNPDHAIKVIESTIQNQVYENSISYIREAKHLVLEKYNLFSLIVDLCNEHIGIPKNNPKDEKRQIEIKPEKSFAFLNLTDRFSPSNLKSILKKLFNQSVRNRPIE
jgi:hypothetical protein